MAACSRRHARRATLLLSCLSTLAGSAPVRPRCRLFVEARLAAGAQVPLDAAQQHYLMSVMRVRDGEPILLFDGASGEWLATVQHTGRRACTPTLLEQTRPQDASRAEVTLFFALLKPKRLSQLVEKATELGVVRLQPLITARTAVREANVEKLRATCIEAAEQCGRLSVPSLLEPSDDLDACLRAAQPSTRLFACDERPGCTSRLDAALARAGQNTPHSSVGFVVGPEGGFSPEEFEVLRARAELVSLGPNVLRAETAAMSALSILHCRLL